MQRAQSIVNGYFGGCIGKRQPNGKMELKKCVNHMYNLRDQILNKSYAGKHRAVSGRMVTDPEMHGTYRGAVEIFQLCRNLRTSNALFAECFRTFGILREGRGGGRRGVGRGG